MEAQTYTVGLRDKEWSNLFATGEIRILRARLLKIIEIPSDKDFFRLFSISANGMLEDSEQMIVATLKIGDKFPQLRHPQATTTELLIIPLNCFQTFQVVQLKDRQHISECVKDFGISLESECLDVNWDYWILQEGVRQRIAASRIIQAKIGLNTKMKRRIDQHSWEDIATCVLRPASNFSQDDSLLISFLRSKTKLIDLTQEFRKTEAHFISSSIEWIKSREKDFESKVETKFSSKIAESLVRSTKLMWNNSDLISKDTYKLLSQIRRRHSSSFNRELSPIVISLYLRHSYQIKNGIFRSEEFKDQVKQVISLDGVKAASLICFLVAIELGLERTRELFEIASQD